MVHPATALSLGVAALAFSAILLWPVKGLLWRLLEVLRVNERVHIEDALKVLYDAEYRGEPPPVHGPATLHGLAGALGISTDRAATLLGRLEELVLVEAREGVYRLTSHGRREALQVLRIHRLWERYLSDQTGFPATEWHARADAREHRMAPAEADALARSMGEPRFDPHGDPIPTRNGEIAPPLGRPMNDLDAGDVGEIVHVEDEPEAIFAQLLAEGLSLGTRVRILDKSPGRIRFETDSDVHVLAPVLAANLTIRLLPASAEAVSLASLADLEPGDRGRVLALSSRCRGPERRRLLDLGFVPGTVVENELRNAGGDPSAYRVRGALIALRRDQAALVHVDPLAHPAVAAGAAP